MSKLGVAATSSAHTIASSSVSSRALAMLRVCSRRLSRTAVRNTRPLRSRQPTSRTCSSISTTSHRVCTARQGAPVRRDKAGTTTPWERVSRIMLGEDW